MLSEQECRQLRDKMAATGTYCATLARRWGVSRQIVNAVLNGTDTSKKIEKLLKEWLLEE